MGTTRMTLALSRSVEHTKAHRLPVLVEPHVAHGRMPNIADGSTPPYSESDTLRKRLGRPAAANRKSGGAKREESGGVTEEQAGTWQVPVSG